ncbi:peptidase S74, partial [Streptococcus pneumoniae]
MDALTRRQFDRAMFAKERTLAIRVGDYASRDIKEASFEYGYIKGDTYKPGGTCAGSGKITFTSIITTFNKLDTLHPEIGLLVGDTYQWVKMGEYFINDIEIDRNRNTTTLELMDGMFKLNREYVTDLHFPAEVREVIQEICLKTGIELANDYFGISAMRYHIEQVPEGKKLSFRDMLSAMTQMIGMSCFFNREGKMEIRDLTESNITINADSYFLHGLTKSEIEYQISGITCKTDKKSLTVGMKTGRSLELDNVFMTQSALNDLYYKLKNLTYYPYNLNYQGHLLLEVGQWVTIQTNKKETFKVPVLSQSFTFKGGLRGRISADSKAGNDTQYSYEGTITKHIKQQDDIEAKIQAQIEAADKDFDQKVDKIKKDFNDQVELTKARAEEVKRELSDTINQRFNSFDNGPLKETKRKAEEALRNAGASTLLAQEAKRIGLDSVARLEAFKSQTTSAQTALSGELDALKRTIVNDIRPKQAQAEAEIAKQAEALNRTKNELAGASTLLAQEAKRIELDSVARLEAFKSQTTSAQTALSGDLDALKRTIANDIRQKQAQAETEIAKQVEALSRTKNELAGVKSAQATYEETTTRRLSELTNLANGKASKSELTQTAEELASRIASVQAGSSRNYFRNSRSRTFTTGGQAVYDYRTFIVPDFWKNSDRFKRDYVRISFDVTFPVALVNDMPAMVHFSAHPWYAYRNLIFKGGTVERQHFEFTIDLSSSSEDYQTNNVFIRFGTNYGFPAGLQVVIENAMLSVGNYFPAYQPAYEDQEDRVSVVESNFKQRADSLDAGVSRLTEGLRTKADISSLNVTAENIRQSVKSLETDTQNKLNQKLSQAEFEVRAGSIRQEILNATKDKASKSELTQTAEELASKIASVQVGGRNYIRGTKRMMLARGLWASGTFRPSGTGTAKTIDVSDSPVTGFDKAIRLTSSNARDQIGIAQDGFYISQGTYTMSCWVKGRRGQKVKLQTYWQVHDNSGISPIFTLKDENWTKLSFTSAKNRAGVASIGYVYLVNAEVGEYLDVLAPQLEDGSLATSSKEAPEDIEGQISTVESTFKQRANSLEAGVNRLTEGLRTKADISSLNVTAENIRQSVKSLETDTQNKLNQKLSQAEFEVR